MARKRKRAATGGVGLFATGKTRVKGHRRRVLKKNARPKTWTRVKGYSRKRK